MNTSMAVIMLALTAEACRRATENFSAGRANMLAALATSFMNKPG